MSSFHITLVDFPSAYGSAYADKIAGANAKLLVCHPSSAEVAVTTDQGASWTTASISTIGGAAQCVAWNGTKFMVARKNKVSFSTDGLTWSTAVTVPTVNSAEDIGSVAANASGWLIGYLSGTAAGGYLAYTSDESSFTVADPTGHKPEWSALAESGGTWYANARDLNTTGVSRFFTSPDGTTWTQQSAAMLGTDAPNYYQIRKVGSTLVIANTSGANPASSTNGGATWAYATSPAYRGFYLDTNAAGTRFVYWEDSGSDPTARRAWDGPGVPDGWGISTIDNAFTYTLVAVLGRAAYSFNSDVRAFPAQTDGTGTGWFSGSKLAYLTNTPPAFWTNLTNATETL